MIPKHRSTNKLHQILKQAYRERAAKEHPPTDHDADDDVQEQEEKKKYNKNENDP